MKKTQLLYVGNKLSRHGHPPTSVETLGPLLSEKYDILLISDKKNKALRMFEFLSAIYKNRHSLKLILIDTYSTTNFYYAWMVAKLAKRYSIPYIPLLRGGNLPERLDKNPGMSSFVFSNSALNIAPSGYLFKEFENRNFPVKHIPNNIRISKYPFKERGKVRPNLLFVRSFHKIYNPLMAVDVFVRVLEKYPGASLCMIGPEKDGSLQETKTYAKKLGVGDKINFTGRLSKEDWIRASEDYDIFINTTNFDNHPVSVVEAMALGLPVVTTNVGGVPYLITNHENGILVEPREPEQMAGKIFEIIENPELAGKLSLNGRKTVENYDWERVKESWYQIVDSYLNA